jgi:chorismate dehydratase
MSKSSPAKRIGSVGSLNTVPLTRGIEGEVHFTTPAKLAELLQRNELDAALVSIVEVLFHDRYDVLDGIGITSRGPVKSVLLAHRRPLEELREVFCDTASLTSVNLVRVLLAERGVRPAFRPLKDYTGAAAHDAVLLIGDRALDFLFAANEHAIWDLGEAWTELTGLPFVYAAWAMRRGAHTAELREKLKRAKDRGLAELEVIVRERGEYDPAFRREYLGGNIRYALGAEEKRGLAKFMELLRKHRVEPVFEPQFVV